MRNVRSSKPKKRKTRAFYTACRFPERGGKNWEGPIVDYKETELLRKFLSGSSRLTSRKRAGTSAQEQSALKLAVKQARFLALIPYAST